MTYTATRSKMHKGYDIRDESGGMVAIVHPRSPDPLHAARIAATMAAAPYMLQILETIALHAPSLDAVGIRELCDEAIAKAKGGAL
ncbi:hypothetical protein UFOVP1375_37 [uncultured Caudovirales phage]|uniref:Uncharacterized protein n=1 Tax=uncultured Caudovirales phage TaxID=2100421 RepID=A0A6J5QSE1_9CAUD|nr:hypothetical protein UFOVP1107_14 [uncultured Caudovirales phage]CAB4187894.1 hypothetical protein UFOVP1171_22 [uncultured Caudovirales phage]CAB4202821.1 hypothetical protein UFOVP1375_37 [uncultured Caudovirales phage]CAB4214777.1 hypothetical protein UFOVP1471_9 [uncultured Caudovirales phage]